MKPGKVRRELGKHYPGQVLDWVKRAKWTRERVPLQHIQMEARPGKPHDPVKVAHIRAAIRRGEKMKPVTLVRTGAGKDKIADGFHRTRALALEGKTHTDAVVGHLEQRSGPWSRAMHDAKLNT